MRKSIAIGLLAGATALSTNVRAGIFADDLSRCLVSKTSVADKTVFIQWLFDAIAQNPDVKATKVSDADLAADNKKMAGLVDRLLEVDCRPQTIEVLKNEGASGFTSSFEVFGKVAANNLFSNPKVSEYLGRYAKDMDQDKLKALATEAGVEPEKITGKVDR
jgi:hypothetical protein